MQAGYTGFDKRLKYLFDNATEVSYTQLLGTGTPIGTIEIDGQSETIYAPSGGGGSSVSYSPVVTGGTQVGILTIDGNNNSIYVPSVSYTPIVTQGTPLGTITVGGSSETIYAPPMPNISYGVNNPSGGNDGDIYFKVSTNIVDIFGSPTSASTADGEITSNFTTYSTYYPYLAFGSGQGAGNAGAGSDLYIQYSFNSDTYCPKTISLYDNFSVPGGWLQCNTFVMYGSNDGTTWDTLFTKPEGVGTRDVVREFNISNNNYYQYFKFVMSSVGGYTGVKGITVTGFDNSSPQSGGIDSIWLNVNGVWLSQN